MEVVSYKCPNCMAPMRHIIEKQQWECGFCATSISAEDMERIETHISTEQYEPPEDTAVTAYEETDGVAAYVCPSCGGRLVTSVVTASSFCVYCHNPMVITSNLTDEHRPDCILPFQLDEVAAIDAMKRLCRQTPLLPKTFRDAVKNGELTGMYIPFWLFGMDVRATLIARCKNVTHWRDKKYKHTQTDIYQVERTGEAVFSNIPIDASIRMDDAMMDALEPFDYGKMVNFSMPYLSGHYAESFDADASTCFPRADERVQKAIKPLMENTVTGYDSKAIVDYRLINREVRKKNVMLPVWLMNVTHGGKQYIFAMNGQTGKVAGRLPVSQKRSLILWLTLGGILTVVFFIYLVLKYLGGTPS